jgi:hypothetical protein
LNIIFLDRNMGFWRPTRSVGERKLLWFVHKVRLGKVTTIEMCKVGTLSNFIELFLHKILMSIISNISRKSLWSLILFLVLLRFNRFKIEFILKYFVLCWGTPFLRYFFLIINFTEIWLRVILLCTINHGVPLVSIGALTQILVSKGNFALRTWSSVPNCLKSVVHTTSIYWCVGGTSPLRDSARSWLFLLAVEGVGKHHLDFFYCLEGLTEVGTFVMLFDKVFDLVLVTGVHDDIA